jgi:hypothetical protein
MAIDADTRGLLDRLVATSVKQGKDPLEVLDGANLLNTPAVRKARDIATLTDLWHRLDNQHASTILQVFTGKNSGTPEDMYRAILDWVEAVLREREAQP